MCVCKMDHDDEPVVVAYFQPVDSVQRVVSVLNFGEFYLVTRVGFIISFHEVASSGTTNVI